MAPSSGSVAFTLPCQGARPQTSCGGMPFAPFADQLSGTCRDYFAIDGWVNYRTADGNWLWVSRDVPLVTFGSQQVLARRKDAPSDMHRVLAMVFNNFWYTNFVGDSHGVMEFQFDLAWRKPAAEAVPPASLAEGMTAEPVVLIQPAPRENPIFIRRLYQP